MSFSLEVLFERTVETVADILRQRRRCAVAKDFNRLSGCIDHHAAVGALLEVLLQVGLEGRVQFPVKVIRKLQDQLATVQCINPA